MKADNWKVRERAMRWLGMSAIVAGLVGVVTPTQARIVRIIVDNRQAVTGEQTIPYEVVRGRAFGVLDPADLHNAEITDIRLATDADGKVRYETTFSIVKPVNMEQSSGLLWNDVPNRGRPIAIGNTERGFGDIGLTSGWEAGNSGTTGIPENRATGSNFWVAVPIAKIDDVPVTGNVLARVFNQSGADSKPLTVLLNPTPYLPATLDTNQATLTTHLAETANGIVTPGPVVTPQDWAFAKCDANNPFPGKPIDIDPANAPRNLPVHICLRNGFDPKLLYQVVYPSRHAYVLGVGMAAFRDVASFFRYEKEDDFGTPNPVAGKIKAAIVRGVSQSGNMVRQFIYMGLNQDENMRQVFEGAWPIIAGRRVATNSRWAQPDGVLELYQAGSEGPQWWVDWSDTVRKLPTKSLFTRCNQTNTCPKVIEHFGAAEVYALKLTIEWTGTDGKADIPLPTNVRRYYVPSSPHGGGAGGFVHVPATTTGPGCYNPSWGRGSLLVNPMPHTHLENLLRPAMRDWVLKGVPPPPSRYPTLASKALVNPTKSDMGFPSNVPGIPDSIFLPENFAWPVFDYDWGPDYDRSEASGVPTNIPPPIQRVIPAKVPRVDTDGNEFDGVPTVLALAPLGTYLGWNITASGFFAGKVCNYQGGYVPFAKTRAERLANGDPRLSLEERYRDHEGYVAAVRAAADKVVKEGYLLPVDRDQLIRQATESTVLRLP